ncbi:MAG TPA: CBS domain-containing protein [Anaerolineae bacterium]|nr:CBS domain-containing protein [Anaerolineae bacterium]
MKQELVKDWMICNVVTVTPDMTLPDAQRLMTEQGIRRLPVVENGHLVGIVTRGDTREADPSSVTFLSTWELNDMLTKTKVGQIMTPKPITISQEATVGEAAQILLEHKISGLPVVDGVGKLVGIITESDIFRLVVRAWSKTTEAG